MADLEFWFDFASPYAYLAAETIEPAAAEAETLLAFFDFAPQSELPGTDIFSGQTHEVTLAQSMLEEPDDQPA